MVAKDARGRGVGRGFSTRESSGRVLRGIRKLELHVFPWNEPAIQLYERYGFEREGYRRAHYHRAGEDVDAMLMAYHLGPDRDL